MEVEPTTESGKRLNYLLTDWMKKSGQEGIRSVLKRVLFLHAPKILNTDSFISVIYGQGVLDETPLNLRQQLTTTILRKQHAIELCLIKGFVKQIIVALEWSSNEVIIGQMLTWAEKASVGAENSEILNSYSMHLAPQKASKTFRSFLSSARPTELRRREREIDREFKSEDLSVLEVCGNKIIIGLVTGRVEIYNSLDLQCKLALPYMSNGTSSITCLQCTCSELIVGYADGKICLWNIETGVLLQKFSVQNGIGPSYAKRMKWRKPKLIVCIEDSLSCGRVGVWQLVNSQLTLLTNWPLFDDVKQMDFDMNHIIVLPTQASSTEELSFYYFNGQSAGTSSITCRSNATKLYGNYLISGDYRTTVRIWDIYSRKCVGELQGHKVKIRTVDAHENFILSTDCRSESIIWSLELALDLKPVEVTRFSSATLQDWNAWTRLGRNVVTWLDNGSSRIKVVDFS